MNSFKVKYLKQENQKIFFYQMKNEMAISLLPKKKILAFEKSFVNLLYLKINPNSKTLFQMKHIFSFRFSSCRKKPLYLTHLLISSLLQCLRRRPFFNLLDKSVVAKSSHPILFFNLRLSKELWTPGEEGSSIFCNFYTIKKFKKWY